MQDTNYATHSDAGGNERLQLVSIIIPCYNCRKFIGEAIESALGQSYRSVEVIVVDDGSSDGTAEIVSDYPVKLVRERHQGVSEARNRGIDASSGEYLVFLDSDDRLLPEAAETGLKALDTNPMCGMAVGAHNIMSHCGEWIATRYKPTELKDGYELLLRSNFIECTSSVMFRRSCFRENQGFRQTLKGAEDYELYLRTARAAPVCCHSNVVSEYRLHSANASHDSRLMLSHTVAVLAEQWPFARKSVRYRWAYLRGAMFWRRKYGRQLTREMATQESKWLPQEERAAWGLLVRTYPQGLLVVLLSRILPRSLMRFLLLRKGSYSSGSGSSVVVPPRGSRHAANPEQP